MNKRLKKKKSKININTIELGNLAFGNSRGKYSIDRKWGIEFYEFLEKCLFDSYGYFEGKKEYENYITKEGGFENDTFIVNPYYWGFDNEIAIKPNFVYKPLNFTISWYKYPFRDSYMNKYISRNEFKNILKKCEESFKEIKNNKGDENNEV